MSTPNLTAIVAATKSNGIGLNGGLPWRLPGEMKYFAKGKSSGNRPQAARPDNRAIARGRLFNKSDWMRIERATVILVDTDNRVTTTNPQTTQNTVIMGRKTWESIPTKFRPLKDRNNLIITRNGIDLNGAPSSSTHSSLESALSSLKPETRAFLIGGSQLYNATLDPTSQSNLNRVLLTRVLSDFECDTFLYDFTNDGRWVKSSHQELCDWIGFEVEEENEEKGVKYRYEMWVLK